MGQLLQGAQKTVGSMMARLCLYVEVSGLIIIESVAIKNFENIQLIVTSPAKSKKYEQICAISPPF